MLAEGYFGGQPPEWVPLKDVFEFLRRNFHLVKLPHGLEEDLLQTIRTRPRDLPHRIETKSFFNLRSGLEIKRDRWSPSGRVIIVDLTKFEQWAAGSIPGKKVGDEQEWLVISIHWGRAIECARLQCTIQKQRESEESRLRIKKCEADSLTPSSAPEAGGSGNIDAMARPKPTRAAIKAWFEKRVASWPDGEVAPSEARDWTDANAYFGDGINRDKDFRPLRASHTPKEWQKQGRRKPWGVVKQEISNTAEDSAKLRPQN